MFLSDALSYAHSELQFQEYQQSAKGHDFETDIWHESFGGCNYGWRWATANSVWPKTNIPVNHDLRNQGYVFWDKARLDSYDIFRSPRSPVRGELDFPPGYQEDAEMPGVEEKLRSVFVPLCVISDIFNELQFSGGGVDWMKFRARSIRLFLCIEIAPNSIYFADTLTHVV